MGRHDRGYSVGMADFTWDEVEVIVHKLRTADLRGLDLSRSNLQCANFYEADLSGAHLSGAKYSADTKWPRRLRPGIGGGGVDV